MTNFQQLSTPKRDQRDVSFQATRLIWLFLVLLEALLAARVLLSLIGANPANLLAAILYNFTGVFLLPFAGLAGNPAAGSAVLDVAAGIAMVAYGLLGWILVRVAWVIFYRPYAL